MIESDLIRTKCLHRDGYRCAICGAPLDECPTGYSIHHRRMRSHPWPGLNNLSNLVCLCGSGTTGCHGRVHHHQAEAYEHGWLVHSWVDDVASIPFDSRRGKVLFKDDGTISITR